MPALTVETIGSGPLPVIQQRLSNLQKPLEMAVRAWRAVIGKEFQAEAWNSPSGGLRPWPKTKPFGNVPAPAKTLQRSGALLAAWLGGPGSIGPVYDQQGALFGVSGAIKYASVHRGGSGKLLTGGIAPLQIPVTPKMRVFLGLNKGVWLKKETKVITIPRRPHATANPEIRTRLTAIFAAWASGRDLPETVTS